MEISGIGSSAYADYLQEQNISETKLKDQIVSASKGEFIKELTEEELNEIEVLKKFEIEKNKEAFNNIIKPFEEVINKLKKRKNKYEK